MNSCVYRGTVRHRRIHPVPHTFRYTLFMMYLDLDEIPGVFDGRWLWSARRPAIGWFRRADYLGDPALPLADAVRDRAAQALGTRPTGPVRMLTHLRYFGLVMNPVTFYYCFDDTGTRPEAILVEITNTPWNERHTYVLGSLNGSSESRTRAFCLKKQFHVSPFMAMNHDYRWQFSVPGRRLVVHMENFTEGGQKLFDASLALRREEISAGTLSRALARHPWMTATVVVGIYWQAFRLWLKRTPFHTHPAKRSVS